MSRALLSRKKSQGLFVPVHEVPPAGVSGTGSPRGLALQPMKVDPALALTVILPVALLSRSCSQNAVQVVGLGAGVGLPPRRSPTLTRCPRRRS